LNPFLKIVLKPGEPMKIENVNSTLYLLDALEGKAEMLEKKWYITH